MMDFEGGEKPASSRKHFPAPIGLQLYGMDEAHVQALQPDWCWGDVKLHGTVIEALGELRRDASVHGFDLRVVSGFRSFRRQLAIWNEKALGLRPVLDAQEQPIDIGLLEPGERVFAILQWSALPGASRHHWGTDFDVIDAAAIPPGYRLRLDVRETCAGGPFAAVHEWLDERIAAGRSRGFFRPYTGSGCDVAPEPWHLSFADLARQCQTGFDPEHLMRLHREAGMELRDQVALYRAEIMKRFFTVPMSLYPGGQAQT